MRCPTPCPSCAARNRALHAPRRASEPAKPLAHHAADRQEVDGVPGARDGGALDPVLASDEAHLGTEPADQLVRDGDAGKQMPPRPSARDHDAERRVRIL